MTQKILSVLIPVYNTEKFIRRCIDSVLNQSLKSVQIIVIDDASTDHSFDILCEYQKQYPQIFVCQQNDINRGQGFSRNQCLKMVDTPYACFLDSDDWVDINAYSHAVHFLEQHLHCDMAMFGIKTEKNNSISSSLRYDYKNQNIVDSNFALELLCKRYSQESYISALLGNKVFRSKLLIENEIRFDEKHFEDILFTYKAICNSNYIGLIPNTYLHYYQRPQSIMHTFSKKYIDDLFYEFVALKEYLVKMKQWDAHKENYYSFWERSASSMMNILFSIEQDVQIQKKYISYYYEKFIGAFPLDEYLDYMDIERIKRLILL